MRVASCPSLTGLNPHLGNEDELCVGQQAKKDSLKRLFPGQHICSSTDYV
jgi:hypothetical protein